MWSKEETLELLNQVENHPMLWKDASKFSRKEKEKAWEQIAKVFGLTTICAKKKINGLITTYRHQKSQLQKEELSGAKQKNKSKWYAYEQVARLFDQGNSGGSQKDIFDLIEISDTEDTKDELESKGEDHRTFDKQQKIERQRLKLRQQEYSSTPKCLYNSSNKNGTPALFVETQLDMSNGSPYTFNNQETYVTEKRKNFYANDRECNEMKKKKLDLDECETYANYVSYKLRRYNTKTRHIVEHQINSILFKADMGHFDAVQDNRITSMPSESSDSIRDSIETKIEIFEN